MPPLDGCLRGHSRNGDDDVRALGLGLRGHSLPASARAALALDLDSLNRAEPMHSHLWKELRLRRDAERACDFRPGR
jgi:hypothetical protein